MTRINRAASAVLVAGAAVFVIALGAIGGARGAAAETPGAAETGGKSFAVDPVHATVLFRVKHLNASHFYGRFNAVAGTFTLGDTASFDVAVKADSVDTNNEKRNGHLKSPDFFAAKEFPEIKCVGTDLKKSGENAWKGSANLTFHGVVKPVEIVVTQTGTGDGKGIGGQHEVAGIETTFTIKRSDFGASNYLAQVSDEVTLIVALEGAPK